MSERQKLAREHGFTETIHCGAFTLHLFHENSLYDNLPLDSGRVIDFAQASFSEDDIPLLQYSNIEILPKGDGRFADFCGHVVFDIPDQWRERQTFSYHMAELKDHLNNAGHLATQEDFVRGQDNLIMRGESHQDASVSFERLDYTTLCININAPVDETKPWSFLYDDITTYTHLWGEIHNFVVRLSGAPYNQYADSAQTNILLGSTPAMTVSEMELAIESQIGERQIVSPSSPSINWAQDIRSSVIESFQRGLPIVPDITEAAATIVREKHQLARELNAPVYITQADVVDALAQQIKQPKDRSD